MTYVSSKKATYVQNEIATYVGESHHQPFSPGATRQRYIGAELLVIAYNLGAFFNQGMENPNGSQSLDEYDPDATNNIDQTFKFMRGRILTSYTCIQYFKNLAQVPNDGNLIMMTIYLQQLQESHVTDTRAVVNIINTMRLCIQDDVEQRKQADLLDAQKKADIAEAQKMATIANDHTKLIAQQLKAAQQHTKTTGKPNGTIKSAFDPHSQPIPPGNVAPDVPFPNLAPPSSKRCTHLSGKYRKTPTDPHDPTTGYVRTWVDYHVSLQFEQMPNNIQSNWTTDDANIRKHWGGRKFTKLRDGVHTTY
jgi:hypothetical protein